MLMRLVTKYVENKTIEFYLDDDNNPILDNEPMTNELYAAVIDAIKNHPDYSDVCETAEPANEEVGPTVAAQNDVQSIEWKYCGRAYARSTFPLKPFRDTNEWQ